MAIKALRSILALALALTLALGFLAAQPEGAAAQGVGVGNAGACSHAANWCGVFGYAGPSGASITMRVYIRDTCNNMYVEKWSATVWAFEGNPRYMQVYINSCYRVDAIVLESPQWITGYSGPYVGW